MRLPNQMKTPGCGGQALGEAVVQGGSDKANSAPHGATSIDRAELMLGFARIAASSFHASYFAKMATKFLQPASAREVADARLDGIRRQWNDFVLSGGRA